MNGAAAIPDWLGSIVSNLSTIGKRLGAIEKHSDLQRRGINTLHDDMAALKDRLQQIERKLNRTEQ